MLLVKMIWEGEAQSAQQTPPLQWRHDERDGVSNHQPQDCVTQPFIQAQMKENIKAPLHWPLRGEFTGHQWIPRKKGQ